MKLTTEHTDLTELIRHAQGDRARIERYMRQFVELIPDRLQALEHDLAANDRKRMRQQLHQMSPQLQFFGIPDVVPRIKRLEHEYDSIDMDEYNKLVEEIRQRLTNACQEIQDILHQQFDS